jgi:integrase
MSTGHRDRSRAKRQAQEIAGTLATVGAPCGSDPTLRTLFDIYEREVTPTKGMSTQGHDRRAMALFLSAFGRQRRANALTRRDWDQFIRGRQAGRITPPDRDVGPAGDRVIQYDLLFLRAVLNWAVTAQLLERNPLAGLPLSKERNPHRPTLDHATYEALLAVAEQIDPRLKLALVLTHETGHRQQAVCHLRW